jgi:hypothetical protein
VGDANKGGRDMKRKAKPGIYYAEYAGEDFMFIRHRDGSWERWIDNRYGFILSSFNWDFAANAGVLEYMGKI